VRTPFPFVLLFSREYLLRFDKVNQMDHPSYPLDFDKPRCNCAVFGIYGHPQASTMTYYGLLALQHRGQEATGIITSELVGGRQKYHFNVHKGMGLVADAFRDESILVEVLKGESAVGHNRYSTAGSANNRANVQPLIVNYKSGNLALSHNGNLTNFRRLRSQLQDDGTIFQTTSDSEIILHLIARSKHSDQIKQIIEALNTVEGAYSLVLLTDDKLVAARDPHGFRPLALGEKDGAFVVASETCAFDIIDAKYLRDILPGEILVIDSQSLKTRYPQSYWVDKKAETPHFCIFEYIYFSRPDSRIYGENVDKIRRKLGKLLAHEHPVKPESDEKPVIAISVPDSSNTATIGYVTESNKLGNRMRFEIGLIRSHYIGRTFIQPEQDVREVQVKTKFNTVKGVLQGRKVVVVDDSIVRGTTSKLLIKLIRGAEPKEIHFRVTCPPIRFPCHYGMDFPSHKELIANQCNGDIEGIRKELGVDSLGYLSLEGMLQAVPEEHRGSYCTACFSGQYPVRIEAGARKDEHEV
jgi:amidophosphoribosyltransferase